MVESLVYPNPFSDAAVLEIGAHEGGISLEIFDANGAKVLEMNEIKENTVNLTLGNLSAGSYFYLLHDKKGLLGRGKFVVK
jgi:hypothetical protein